MTKHFIPLSKTIYNKAISKYVNEALVNNEMSLHGNNIDGLERDLKDYLNTSKEIVVLNSGTAAIHLALVQLGVSKGDEVICQSFTFCGSANPIIYQGATPVFVDSEAESWNMCPALLESAIKDRIKKGNKPKAIILVHLYGMPAKLNELLEIANHYNIPVIEDAAEALGSTYRGRKCGTFGTFSVLSFNGNKIITTSGGGALVCRTKKEKEKTIFYATQARDEAPHYQHTFVGFNYRMSNINAGIGRGQMEVLTKHLDFRKKMNKFYQNLFCEFDGVEVFTEKHTYLKSNHWLSCILFRPDGRITRQELHNSMARDNIETRPLWKPMHLQPVFKDQPSYLNGVSEALFRNGLCLPSGSNLTDQDKQRIQGVIHGIFNKKYKE